MNFSFVILHYESINDTLELINSIQKNVEGNYEIIVVDNGSKTNRFNIDSKKENIHTIISDSNLGFAKGMNLGIDYAKKNYQSGFIVLLNNDTLINDKKFIEKVISKFDKYNYYVLGPKIISLVDGKNQNPVYSYKFNYDIITVFRGWFKYLLLYTLSILRLEKFVLNIKKRFLSNNRKTVNKDNSGDITNVPLQGSCLILSPKFNDDYNGLYEKTFLYGEEIILYYQMNRDSNLVLYSDDICIYHKEGSSTNLTIQSHKKRRFQLRNICQSRFEFLKLVIKDKF
jgi:GT2 family glycosyltransferase